jgi:CHAT domain-containing protein
MESAAFFLDFISFASLKLPDGKYFCQRQEISQLQTGRDLLAGSAKNDSNLLVAFGGVEYGKAEEKAQEKTDEDMPKHLNMRAARELKSLTYLKHSFEEAANIAETFRTNTKGKVLFFSKSEATEKNLKNLPFPPRILHLSTHGFYLQNAELTDWAEEAPLLLSGLALSGANEGLQGKLDANGDDGLLYSMEVLGLNLQGTELVSLSACDTGKGVVDYSEGVYGLVRAFRTAGAQSVLMTLRPVGDASSRIFMETFYDTWLSSEKLTPSEALHQTRLRFIENPPKPGYDDPSVWSPYVLVGP